MATIKAKLTDAVIKKYLSDETVTDINAIGEPFVIRYHSNRQRASFLHVYNEKGKTKRVKLGNWPDFSVKDILARKHELLAKDKSVQKFGEWQYVKELIEWYRDRALSDRNLSVKRKRDVKSFCNKHLIPCLGREKISDLNQSILDNEFIWPLQNRYTVGTVRQHFALLKRIFRQAHTLKKIPKNPIRGIVFTDFIKTKMKAKISKLRAHHLPELIARIKEMKQDQKLFITTMLAHGTRIGETRQLKWESIDNINKRLIIPQEITKTNQELILPLTNWMMDRLNHHRADQIRLGSRTAFIFPMFNGSFINEIRANDWVKKCSRGEWTAHDLRKLARTSWADLGVDYLVAEMLLNHALRKLDQAYIHTQVESQKRAALELWHAELNKYFDYATTTPKRHVNDSDCSAETFAQLEPTQI